MPKPDDKQDIQWLQAPEEQEGLRQYVETIRERKWLVLGCVLVTSFVALLYVLTATKQYEATADILVTPASTSDDLLGQLGVIRDSADPSRDIETAARVLDTTEAAKRTAQSLGLSEPSRDLLAKITVQPVATSNVVGVTATEDSPEKAQTLANGFAQAAVDQRTDVFHQQVTQLLGGAPSARDAERLQSLANAPDPTVRLETPAEAPAAPSSPRTFLSIAGGILAGLILGIIAAFASRLLDPRIRREDQLRRHFRLPILARVPVERTRRKLPLGPGQASRPVVEAYRTLRSTLAASRTARSQGPRAVLVSGSSPSEGKTTTAINLATSLALRGDHVILIEGDLRRPSVAKALGLKPERGIVDVLLETAKIEDALVTDAAYGATLGFLLADQSGDWTTELFSLPSAQRMIEDAKRLADYVIIDSPPLNDVVDALPLTRSVDDVLLVVRLGRSRLDRVNRVAELLANYDVKPAGFVVIGTDRPGRFDYSYYAETDASKQAAQPNGAGRGGAAVAGIRRALRIPDSTRR